MGNFLSGTFFKNHNKSLPYVWLIGGVLKLLLAFTGSYLQKYEAYA